MNIPKATFPQLVSATPGGQEETPSRDYLGWLASIMPGTSPKDDVDRLEERRLEELSQEVYGY